MFAFYAYYITATKDTKPILRVFFTATDSQ